MAMGVSTRTITTNQNHRASDRELGSVWPGLLYNDNVSPAGGGETNYGKVLAGTVMSKDSNGLYHPCGWQVSDAIGSGVNVMTVDDGSNFYVGDLIEIISVAGKLDAVTIDAGDDTSTLVITAVNPGDTGLKISLVNPSTDTAALSFTRQDGSDILIAITLTYSSAAINTTVAELAAFIVANRADMGFTASDAETDADLCQAVGATALTGGLALGATVVDARAVTASTSTTVTWDGGTSTFAAGDYLLKTGAHRPYGISERVVSTIRYVDDTLVTESKAIDVSYGGDLRTGQVVGLSDALKLAMQGGPYVDPQALLAGTLINPHAGMGFVFMAV